MDYVAAGLAKTGALVEQSDRHAKATQRLRQFQADRPAADHRQAVGKVW